MTARNHISNFQIYKKQQKRALLNVRHKSMTFLKSFEY